MRKRTNTKYGLCVIILCLGLFLLSVSAPVRAEEVDEDALPDAAETDYLDGEGEVGQDEASESVDLRYESEQYGTVLVVNDSENLFSDSEIRTFTESAAGVLQYANVAVVTSAEEDYEGYAQYLYDQYFGNDSDSTLFMINMNPRNIYIYSNGKIKQTLDKEAVLSITDNIYRQARMGAYYACAEKALSQEATLLSGGRILKPMKYIGNFFLAFMLAILLTFYLTFSLRPKVKKEAIAGFDEKVLAAMAAGILFSLANEQRIYDPVKDSSSSSGGGGGGGGGSSGVGGGHSF